MSLWILAGGESADELTGSWTLYDANAAWLEPNTVRAGYRLMRSSDGPIWADLKGARNRVWHRHFLARNAQIGGSGPIGHYSLYDGVNERLRFTLTVGAAGIYMKCEAVNGATLTTLISTTDVDYPFFTVLPSNAFGGTCPINYDVNYSAAGWVRIYNDDRLVGSFTGDPRVGGSTTLSKASLSNGSNATSWSEWTYSGMIWGDEDTRGLKIITHYPNAAGDVNTFSSGVYTAVDEQGDTGTDYAESLVANQKYLFNILNVPAAWGTIDVRQVSVRSRTMGANSGGPTQAKQLVKTNATEYQAPAKTPSTVNYQLLIDAFDNNPVTGVAWTKAEIDALQIGMLSVA